MSVAWLGGRLVPESRATVSAFDRGFLFGDGVYETVRAYAGIPFLIHAHLGRLRESARALGIRVPATDAAMAHAATRVIRADRIREARIRVVLTRGPGEPELGAIRVARHPTLLVYARPFVPPPRDDYRRGLPVIMAKTVRNDARALSPAIKATSMLNNLMARLEADRAGAFEAVMCNPSGRVAECATANCFFVRGGTLYTPGLAAGILHGITRDLVIRLAHHLRIPVREGAFRPRELLAAREAFVTNSIVEIMPVSRIGRRRFPGAGPVTAALQEAYRMVVDRTCRRRRRG